MTLADSNFNETYTVADIATEQKEIKDFLFTLGCYPGEDITVISKMASNYVINIKDARYSIDDNLASAIKISCMSENFPLSQVV